MAEIWNPVGGGSYHSAVIVHILELLSNLDTAQPGLVAQDAQELLHQPMSTISEMSPFKTPVALS